MFGICLNIGGVSKVMCPLYNWRLMMKRTYFSGVGRGDMVFMYSTKIKTAYLFKFFIFFFHRVNIKKVIQAGGEKVVETRSIIR